MTSCSMRSNVFVIESMAFDRIGRTMRFTFSCEISQLPRPNVLLAGRA